MIRANHKKWADFIFHRYLHRLFRRHFFAIHLLDPVPCLDTDKPVLLLPNHSTWWDGFFIYLINRTLLQRKVYLMMQEDQLKQNPFFQYLGVYSVKPGSYTCIRQSLEYTLNLINQRDESPLICFFPQGELQPWHVRPIRFKRGLSYILRNIQREVSLCFMGIRIEHTNEQHPEVFIELSLAGTMGPDYDFSTTKLESDFNTFLDSMQTKIINGEKSKILLHGQKSINDRFRYHRQKEETA